MTGLLARLPLRLRLTAAFAIAMTVVLLALGLFLAERLEAGLTAAIDQGLATRADQLASDGPGEAIGGSSELTEHGSGLAQIMSARGAVLTHSPGLTRPLLTEEQLARVASGRITYEVPHTQVSDDATRILAYATRHGGTPIVVAVGAAVEPLHDARNELIGLLLIGGPLALMLASALGYAVAAAALRPVERMRAQAESVSADDPKRLTLPPANDELRALGVTLNRMLDRLQETLDRERAFTLDASHELRTPLAVLKAELEVALRPQRTREEHVAALRSASQETDRLTRLAEDLLVLARAEERGLPVRRARFNVDALLSRVTARFAELAGERGTILDYTVEPGLEVVGDESRLEQAISNLLANAINHGGELVMVTAAKSSDTVTLTVSDNGSGFPAALLPHAFERFTQSDASRHASGTGLGLAIVQAIAHAHGGSASAQNKSSGGARVQISFPAVQED